MYSSAATGLSPPVIAVTLGVLATLAVVALERLEQSVTL